MFSHSVSWLLFCCSLASLAPALSFKTRNGFGYRTRRSSSACCWWCLCSHADQFGESRLAFKVKSTNNDHYRLKPVFGFVEPGQTAALEVTRTAGPPKEDKLVIQFLEVAADVTDAAELFKSGAPQEITLPASAQ